MRNHVLYVSYDGMTDPLGQSQVLPYLCGLSESGYRFSLISFEKRGRFEDEKEHIQELCNRYNITWHPQKYTKRPPVFSTVYDIRKMFRIAESIHQEKPVDIVHCRSYISALCGERMKRRYGIKWVFDMRGFWADERVEGKIWNLENPLFRLIFSWFKKKERSYLSGSDAVVSLTHAAKNEMLTWHVDDLTKDKIAVIPCCADLTLFNPHNVNVKKANDLKRSLELENAFVLGYVGSLGTWYDLSAMFTTFRQIQLQKTNALFLLVTKEPAEKILSEAKAAGVNPSSVRITSCSHKDVPVYISLFDCSIFYIQPSYSKMASSPTKQGELMAMGIPIICNSGVGDTEGIIRKYNGGIIVDLKKTSDMTADSYDLKDFNAETTQFGAREYFSLEMGLRQYNMIYKKLVEG